MLKVQEFPLLYTQQIRTGMTSSSITMVSGKGLTSGEVTPSCRQNIPENPGLQQGKFGDHAKLAGTAKHNGQLGIKGHGLRTHEILCFQKGSVAPNNYQSNDVQCGVEESSFLYQRLIAIYGHHEWPRNYKMHTEDFTGKELWGGTNGNIAALQLGQILEPLLQGASIPGGSIFK